MKNKRAGLMPAFLNFFDIVTILDRLIFSSISVISCLFFEVESQQSLAYQ